MCAAEFGTIASRAFKPFRSLFLSLIALKMVHHRTLPLLLKWVLTNLAYPKLKLVLRCCRKYGTICHFGVQESFHYYQLVSSISSRFCACLRLILKFYIRGIMVVLNAYFFVLPPLPIFKPFH